MQSSVYCNGRVSVRLSHRSIAPAVCGGFGVEHHVGRRINRQMRERAAGAVQQGPALSSNCGQRHVHSRRRKLNIGLVYVISEGNELSGRDFWKV